MFFVLDHGYYVGSFVTYGSIYIQFSQSLAS